MKVFPRAIGALLGGAFAILLTASPAASDVITDYYYTGTAMSGVVALDTTTDFGEVTLYGGGHTYVSVNPEIDPITINSQGQVISWAATATNIDGLGTASICGNLDNCGGSENEFYEYTGTPFAFYLNPAAGTWSTTAPIMPGPGAPGGGTGYPSSAACQADLKSGFNAPTVGPLPWIIQDSFSPSVGLAQAAKDCGVAGFNWQQTFTLTTADLTCGDPSCNPTDPAATQVIPSNTSSSDPTQYGLPYCNPASASYQGGNNCSNSFPYYYPPTESIDPSTYCIGRIISDTLCLADLETGNSALNFYDAPDYFASGATGLYTTELVGVPLEGEQPISLSSNDDYTFEWSDNYGSTNTSCFFVGFCGGIDIFPINDLADNPTDNGTGGITVINVETGAVPEPSSIALLGTGIFVMYACAYRRRGLLSRSRELTETADWN